MKTAMKRLLSLVLVAMMLVSVVPFQASAEEVKPEATSKDIAFTIYTFVGGELLSGTTETKNAPYGTFTKAQVLEFLGISGYEKAEMLVGGNDEPVESVTVDESGPADSKIQVNVVMPQTDFNVKYTVNFIEKNGSTVIKTAGATVVTNSITSAKITEWVNAAKPEGRYTYETAIVTNVAIGTSLDLTNPVTVTGDMEIVINVPTYSEKKIEFIDEKDSDKVVDTQYTVNYKWNGSAPTGPKHDGFTFDRWDTASEGNGYDMNITELTGTLNKDYKFYARYKGATTDNPDGKSNLKVVAKRYVDGREKEQTTLKTYVVDDGANVYDYLMDRKSEINSLINAQNWNGEWVDGLFYENSKGSEEIDSYDKMDGERTVYVMVGEGRPIKVQLYMHTSYNKEPEYIINMFGYEFDDILYKSDINEAIEGKWGDTRKYTWTGMYTTRGWTDILADKENVTALKSFSLSDDLDEDRDGIVEVHIYAKKVSSNNSTNPKTGDTVMMAVTVLGLSASALVALYFVGKKKRSV